jgi:methylated-DNA-protein-cysteine methyltransferase-like protein
MRARRSEADASRRGGAGGPRAGGVYARIYAVVRRIPRGRVATYGQIARLLAMPGRARQVGYAMSALADERVPWHRVLNAKGEVSPRAEPGFEALQRRLLEREGVRFDANGRVSLARCGWDPEERVRTTKARRGARPRPRAAR